MHTQINVVIDKVYAHVKPWGRFDYFKKKISYIPMDYPLLGLSKTAAISEERIGLLQIYVTDCGVVKHLVRQNFVKLPFYVFKNEVVDNYKREHILVPKLLRDLRNVPRYLSVFKAIENEDTIYVDKIM